VINNNISAWSNRAIFSLVWPLVIEQLLAVTMGAADTIMVRSVGVHAVTGVNIIDNINNLLIIVFTALAGGGAVVISQYIGRGDGKNASFASRQLIYITLTISSLMMVIAVVLRRPIITIFYGAIADDVMDAASIYFLVTALSYPLLGIYNANASIFRAVGDSRTPMLIALLVNIMNIGGNAILILVLKTGVVGAALSTLISRLVACIITLLILHKGAKKKAEKLIVVSLKGIRNITFAPVMVRSILNIAIPGALESSMFQVGRLLTQRIFTSFGTDVMSGNAIAGVINSFSFMPGFAFCLALVTIVGQCVGAGDYDGAKRNTKKIMFAAYIAIWVCSGSILIFVEPLVRLFSLSTVGYTAAVLFLRVHCISMMIAWAPSFALPNSLRAGGDAKYVMWVATISMWVVRVSFAYILTFVLNVGPVSVWIAMGVDFLVRGSFYIHRWNSGKWMGKKVIEDGE
jgi:putative MATE family efflux protein